MIVKSLSRRSGTSQLISYLFSEKKSKNKTSMPVHIKHNLRSRSIKGWEKEFKANEELRLVKRKDSVVVNHVIISFNNLDTKNITDNILKDIAKKFIELRGKENIYLGAIHADRQHSHIHFAIPGIEYMSGKSNRISKSEFHNIKLELGQYQQKKYPQLINSLPDHGKSKKLNLSKEKRLQQAKGNRQTKKETLLHFLEKTFTISKSKEEFLSKLSQAGYTTYERGGKLTGVKAGDLKFRFSRLGYDEKVLNKIEEKQKEKAELDELRELRNTNSIEHSRINNLKEEKESKNENEIKETENNDKSQKGQDLTIER